MEYYKVNSEALESIGDIENSLKNILNQCVDTVNSVKGGLSSQATVSRYCSMVSKAASALEKNAEKTNKMQNILKNVTAAYRDAEKKCIAKIEDVSGLSAIIVKQGKGSKFAKTTAAASIGTSVTGVGKRIWDSEVDNRRVNEKTNIESFSRSKNAKSEGGSVSIFGDRISCEKQTDYVSLEGKAVSGKNHAKASGEYNMESAHIDWKTSDLTGTIVENGTKAYVAGEVDVAKGNVYGKAGLEYTAYGITAHAGGDGIFQVDVGGNLGVGGSVKAGISDGRFSFNVSGALGFGGSFGFSFDYKNFGKAIEGIFDQPFFPWDY